MRLTSDFWIKALIKRENASGSFCTIVRRGDETAGAIFVLQARFSDSKKKLFGPQLQLEVDEFDRDGRKFELIYDWSDESEIQNYLMSQMRFDMDLWIVEIEKEAELDLD